MGTSNFEQEWLSGNSQFGFPLKEPSPASTNPAPAGLFVDLRLFLTGYVETETFISSFAYDSAADAYTITFSLVTEGTPVLTGTLSRLTNLGASRVFLKQSISQGARVALFTPGQLWADPSWGGVGSWTQTWAALDSAIEPAAVIPGAQTLGRIFIDDEEITPRNEWPTGGTQKLIAGYNMSFGVGKSLAPSVNIFGNNIQSYMELNCIPGAGLGYPPTESGPLGYWALVNNIPMADSKGNVLLTLNDCLRVSQPIDDTQKLIPNTLQLSSDCIPCCACPEYLFMSRAEGRRSAKIKDLCNIIASLLESSTSVYNDAIDTINSKRPSMVVVRNVQVLSANVRFTVTNVSSTPIFAYIAINFSASTPITGISTFAPETNLVTLSQTGADIYPVIDNDRPNLPALPFVSEENPTAGFPTAHFSPEFGDILLRVGALSASAPFAAIAPGATVSCLIYSTDINAAVEAAIAAYNASEIDLAAVYATTLAAKQPVIKFRSVAVYGASKSYACSAETYEVAVKPNTTTSSDLLDSLCGASLTDQYQAVPNT